MRLRWIAPVSSLSLVAAMAACDDGGPAPEPSTADRSYVAAVCAARATYDAAVVAAGPAIASAPDDLQAGLVVAPLITRYSETLTALTPPADAAEAHDRYLRDLRAEIDRTQSDREVGPNLPFFVAKGSTGKRLDAAMALEAACNELDQRFSP